MKKRWRRGGFVSGVTLILIGIAFLADNLGVADIARTWYYIPLGVLFAFAFRVAFFKR